MTVGITVVSHSARIAAGVVELCRQMAPSVPLAAAGGTDDGALGTSLALVQAALADADAGDGVVAIGDLGSALLIAETAVELGDASTRVRVVDGPLVEGAIAAAVAAEGGAGLEEVAAAALGLAAPTAAAVPEVSADIELPNEEGLHARPAAALVRLAGRFDAAVRVNGVDGRSLLKVISLGLRRGDVVHLAASGPDAGQAIEALHALIARGFEA